MLELDTTIMTPAPVFETSGHVARFADWMVKDSKTGDVLRADHLVKNVLEARLAGDKEARGLGAQPQRDDKKKKKKAAKAVAVQLPDELVKEYETILAQVCNVCVSELKSRSKSYRSITIRVRNWESSVESTKLPTLIRKTK
jgi:glycyl-tRNA synthetase